MLTIVLSEFEVIQFPSYFQPGHSLPLLPLGVFQIIDMKESQGAFAVLIKMFILVLLYFSVFTSVIRKLEK